MITSISLHTINKVLPNYKYMDYPDYIHYGLIGKDDLQILISLLVSINARDIFEIGTWEGKTTKILTNYIDKIYTVDLPIEMITTEYIPDIQQSELSTKDWVGYFIKDNYKVTQFYGNTGDISVIKEIRNSIGHYVDAVIVDGNHSFGYVLADSLTALSMTKKDGMIIWDDVFHSAVPDVTKALELLPYKICHVEGTKIGFMLNNESFACA